MDQSEIKMSREYQQHILNVLADIWGREHGVAVKLTLMPQEEKAKEQITKEREQIAERG